MATIKKISKILCSRCKRKREAKLFVARSKRCKSCRGIYWKNYVSSKHGSLRHRLAQQAYLKRQKRAEKRA